MNFRNLLMIASLATLAACSTTPISTPATTGPAIVFVRDAGFVGSACTFNVLVDGEVAGQLKAGETVARSVSAGKHRVGIDNATGMCPNVKMSKVVEVVGDPIVLRIGITSNFQVIFDQVE